MADLVHPEPWRFHDGGLPGVGGPGEPPDPTAEPHIVLERTVDGGRELFTLARRIGYADRELGGLLVPADPRRFRSDLTSVPVLFTWLVPRTGEHLPAALVHDGLVHDEDEPPSYVSTGGHVVDRVQADRVFRDAMADAGTTRARRWLIWAAVATWTMLDGRGTGWAPAIRWRHRLAAGLTILVIAWLGGNATWDLVDGPTAGPLLGQVPWILEGDWWSELLLGAAGAVVVPLLLGLTWGRFRVAGWILGIGMALLLHVSVVLLLLTGGYRLVEWAIERR